MCVPLQQCTSAVELNVNKSLRSIERISHINCIIRGCMSEVFSERDNQSAESDGLKKYIPI